MTKQKKLAIFEQGKATPLLPSSDADWVEPFNSLLGKLNVEQTDHPLLKGLGSQPSRNSLVQQLITIGLDTVSKYNSRVFIDTSNLSQEIIELLHTSAGQRVVSNLLAAMDGKPESNLQVATASPAKVGKEVLHADFEVTSKVNDQVSEEDTLGKAPNTSQLPGLTILPENTVETVVLEVPNGIPVEDQTINPRKLSPVERARMMSKQSNLST